MYPNQKVLEVFIVTITFTCLQSWNVIGQGSGGPTLGRKTVGTLCAEPLTKTFKVMHVA